MQEEELSITFRVVSSEQKIERNLHDRVFSIASDIASMPPDPLYRESIPNGIIVGSYAQQFNPNAKDVDFEVYGVSSDHLIEEIPRLECFRGRIKIIEIRGNAYKAITVVLEDGLKVDFSVPILEPNPPKRYVPSSIVESPEATFIEAAKRRRFTFDSLAYDPLADSKLDPFNGSDDLKNRVLRPATPWFYCDPINLPYAIRLLAKEGWSPSADLEETLRQMVRSPGDRAEDNFSDYRFRWEISRWFVSEEAPSRIFTVSEQLGFLDVEAPVLGNLRSVPGVWGQVLDLLDNFWQDSKSDAEAVRIGNQIGVLFSGVQEANRVIFNRIKNFEESRLDLVALMKAFVPQGSGGTFEEELEVALETSERVLRHLSS